MERLIISDKDVSMFPEVCVALAVLEGNIIHATSVEESMVELKELIQAAGSETKAEIIVKQPIDKEFYLDKKTLSYVASQAKELGATTLVTIDELTGEQLMKIEEFTGLKVVDRTMLLLDIFAFRTTRREGKIEIERAQLKYRLQRLEGFQGNYKYGSGIGVNSPSGKRLLTDEDLIKKKISALETDLKVIVKNRFVQRSKKKDVSTPLVAFIGYTNSGKSTIMNKFIERDPDYTKESEVVVKDKILSTLDVSLRKSKLPNGKDFLVVDTVGFVSDVPRNILNSFRSTFEEVAYADLVLVVYDVSSNELEAQKNIMDYTLGKIGAQNTKRIRVYNKADRLEEIPESTEDTVFVSAKSGLNMDLLLDTIQKALYEGDVEATLLIPYSQSDVFNKIKSERRIDSEDFKMIPEGIELKIVLNKDEYEKYKKYVR